MSIRVFHINTYFSAGGTARVVNGICGALLRNGDACEIAAARGDTHFTELSYRICSPRSVLFNAAIARIADCDGFMSPGSTRRLIRRIEAFDPDVIHLHNLHGYYIHSGVLFDYLRHCRRRIVWTLHDCWPTTGHCSCFTATGCREWDNGCRKCPFPHEYPKCVLGAHSARNIELKRRTFTEIENLTIAVSSQWLAGIVRRSFLSGYPIEIIPNGVDIHNFRPVDSDIRLRYGLQDKTVLLGVASTWIGRKGLDEFVSLAHRLGDGYAIVMAGVDEKLRRRLPERIISLPVIADVDRLAALYSAADLVLNVSHEESFGLVTIEALACGTPVVVYDTTACPEPLSATPSDTVGDSAADTPLHGTAGFRATPCGIIVEKEAGTDGLVAAIESRQWSRATPGRCRRQAALYEASAQYSRYLALYHPRSANP